MAKSNPHKKVLIVEDDPNFLIILQKKFESGGFAVACAEDGKDCIEMIEKEKPDMIVSDVLLPRMDGVEMAQKIKERGISVPILFLSNLKDSEYDSRLKKVGKFECLLKSDIRIEDIVQKVKEMLNI